ncbi:hypothetical protein MKY91_07600 [Alkalicoccobacillus gibsonii]|jgi:hypothetical protein|uniref:DUF3918 domain-containing protein n=1 Tax=Alkalicoccobacillus gibsonii TaxID=79881 RepID=A0ABU9VHC6_9BACI
MRRTMKPLLLVGLGAAIYSMNQAKSMSMKDEWLHKLEKLTSEPLISKKQWKKTRKKVMKAFR